MALKKKQIRKTAPRGAMTTPTLGEIKLASILVHLAEYHNSGEPVDLFEVRSLLQQEDVADLLHQMKGMALLPVTRSGQTIAELLDAWTCLYPLQFIAMVEWFQRRDAENDLEYRRFIGELDDEE